jgi:acyl dehydratase
LNGINELERAVGSHLGYSDWHTITQDQIDTFAEATGDHQWIHVDPHRAATGPFGTTIAHGYLTLSLVAMLIARVYRVDGLSYMVNYGANKLRFPSPVPVGSRIRAGVELRALTPNAIGYLLESRVTIERDGGEKPACVVDVLAVLAP